MLHPVCQRRSGRPLARVLGSHYAVAAVIFAAKSAEFARSTNSVAFVSSSWETETPMLMVHNPVYFTPVTPFVKIQAGMERTSGRTQVKLVRVVLQALRRNTMSGDGGGLVTGSTAEPFACRSYGP